MSYEVKGEIILRLNEGDHPNVLWAQQFHMAGEPEVIDGVKTHLVSISEVTYALFCAIQESLDRGEGEQGSEVDKAYAVSCAEHIIKHYSKKEES